MSTYIATSGTEVKEITTEIYNLEDKKEIKYTKIPAPVGSGTQYKFLSSKGEFFVSFTTRVGSTYSTYYLDRDTNTFILGSYTHALRYFFETDDGDIYASNTNAGLYKFNKTTKLFELQTRFCEYFGGDGTTTAFEFKNPLVTNIEKVIVNSVEVTNYTEQVDSGKIISITFDSAPVHGVDIVVIFNAELTGRRYMFYETEKGDYFATVTGQFITRYDRTHKCFEVVHYYVNSSANYALKTHNDAGDAVFTVANNQGNWVFILPYGAHSIPEDLQVLEAMPSQIMHPMFNNDIWMVSSNSSSTDRGIAYYNATTKKVKRWFIGVYGGAGFTPAKPIMHPTTEDVLVNSMNMMFFFKKSANECYPIEETHSVYYVNYIPLFDKIAFSRGVNWTMVTDEETTETLTGSSVDKFFMNNVAMFKRANNYMHLYNEETGTWSQFGSSLSSVIQLSNKDIYTISSSYMYRIFNNATTTSIMENSPYLSMHIEYDDYVIFHNTNVNYSGMVVVNKSDNTFKYELINIKAIDIFNRVGNSIELVSRHSPFGIMRYNLVTGETTTTVNLCGGAQVGNFFTAPIGVSSGFSVVFLSDRTGAFTLFNDSDYFTSSFRSQLNSGDFIIATNATTNDEYMLIEENKL